MLNLKEKEEKYKAFLKESQKDFDNKHVNQFVYLDRVGNNADGDGYKEAVQVKKSTYFVCCEKEKIEKSRKYSAFIN